MRKTFISAVLVTVMALFTAIGVGAITFGQPDNEEHPYVGTLLFTADGVDFYSCTGTLLSSTVMLTAGHCVEDSGVTNLMTFVTFEEDAIAGTNRDLYPRDEDGVGRLEWLQNEWIAASEVIPHPNYADYATFPNTYDIGLVILSEPVELERYGYLPALGRLDEILAERGNRSNRFTAVGYGLLGANPAFYADDYARYKSSTRLIELNSYDTGDEQSAKFTNNPGKGNGGEGGTCFGDSGGPIFEEGTNIIVAIVSWGVTPCIGVDFQFRMDTDLAQDFVNNPYSE